jgi:thioesterase domain-containing protein
MAVRVTQADTLQGIRLVAPLEPNLNHRHTVFGGSVVTLAITAAWGLVHFGLREADLESRVVIQRGDTEYLLPLATEFEAFAAPIPPETWERFLRTLTRRGRARITVSVELREAHTDAPIAATFTGDYVALRATP